MNLLLRLAHFAWLCVLASGADAQTDRLDRRQQAEKAYEAAVADPESKAAFDAFLATLPRTRSLFSGETLYLLERDLPRTAGQVRAYLRARAKPPQDESPVELKLHMVDGKPMCWGPESRTLRYAVWQPGFDESFKDGGATYRKMVATARGAMDEWENVCPESECGIKFVHAPDLDTASLVTLEDALRKDRIRFFIYYQKGDAGVLARAFFPGADPESRNLEVNDATIELLDATPTPGLLTARGVIRHELGHVLGYRHEHMKLPTHLHCQKEGGQAFDATTTDSISVMHYDCGGKKPPGSDDVISELDKVGHRKIYGKQAPGHVCGMKMASVP